MEKKAAIGGEEDGYRWRRSSGSRPRLEVAGGGVKVEKMNGVEGLKGVRVRDSQTCFTHLTESDI